MDLNKVINFRAVADAGSISRACAVTHLSQPALSLQMQALEEELEVTLFERTNRGLLLTEEGRVLYERSILLEDWKNETSSLLSGQSEPAGTLKVASYTTASSYLLMPILKSFFTEFPQVELLFEYCDTKEALAKIKTLELDCAIMSEIPDIEGIQRTPLYKNELILVGSAKERSLPSRISPSELSHHPFLLYPHLKDFCYAEVNKHYGKYIQKATQPIQSESFDTLKQGLIAGLGVSFVPEYIVRNELKEKKLKRVEISGPKLPIQFYFVTKAGRQLSGKVEAFREFVINRF